ncbi:MAG: hypothetical protein PHN31_03795, partial [Candidatus Gracilibacteria bacterium]|nr:hypothetical protein [Candidatus Gracilibacteria bacterium]
LTSKQKLELLKTEVYNSISNEFNISHDTAEKLQKLKQQYNIGNIDEFKDELEKHNQINIDDKNNILAFTNDRLNNLYNTISGAEKLTLEENLDSIEVYVIGEKDSFTKKYFPKLYEKSVNPVNYQEQIVGFCLGGLDSCTTTLKFLFDVGSGIIKTPKHSYIIITGKGQYKNISRKEFLIYFAISFGCLVYIIFKLFI